MAKQQQSSGNSFDAEIEALLVQSDNDFQAGDGGQQQQQATSQQQQEEENPADPENDQMAKLEQRLRGEIQQNSQSSLVQQVLSIPGVAQVLEAQRTGRKVKVVEDTGPEQQVTPELAPEDLSDPKKLMAYMEASMRRVTNEVVDSKLQPLVQKIQLHEQTIEGEQTSRMEQLIEASRQKHADFENFVPAMKAINVKTGRSLEPEQLYILARQAAGRTQQARPRREMESERPMSEAPRPSRTEEEKSSGNRDVDFNSALDKAFDRAATKRKQR